MGYRARLLFEKKILKEKKKVGAGREVSQALRKAWMQQRAPEVARV